MSASLVLLPAPRKLTLTGSRVTLPANGVIIAAPADYFAAQQLQAALQNAGLVWSIAAAVQAPGARIILQRRLSQPTQGYRLTITPNEHAQLNIEGDAAGLFYGAMTLTQLIAQQGAEVPALVIEDAPDFLARGVMLDVSRDKVPTLATLKLLVDRLARLKINQLQLYMEHTFAYSAHPLVWQQASPYTPQDILELDAYCRQRFIELVPNQNSLGHMERWLKFPQYNALAECPAGFMPPWGSGWRTASTLDPQDPGSIALIRSLYDELLPHFTSRRVNVGGDEPWELGKGKSQAAVEERGGRVYLEYLLKLHRLMSERDLTMQFWGDIIMHYPELIPELPRDAIALEWGYEANHPFAEHAARFATSGIPFYVCPGTSSWNSLVGRTDNAIGNIRLAADTGLAQGAVGVLNTDWGDYGHWQPLAVSYLGFAYGAAMSWCVAANRSIDLPAALDSCVFQDPSQTMGRWVYDLGNVYKRVGPEHVNGQILARALQWDASFPQLELYTNWGKAAPNITPENLRAVIGTLDTMLADLPAAAAAMNCPDHDLIRQEFAQATALLRHGAKWLLHAQGTSDFKTTVLRDELEHLICDQRAVWLARNRSGGLDDSIARFDVLRGEYARLMA